MTCSACDDTGKIERDVTRTVEGEGFVQEVDVPTIVDCDECGGLADLEEQARALTERATAQIHDRIDAMHARYRMEVAWGLERIDREYGIARAGGL